MNDPVDLVFFAFLVFFGMIAGAAINRAQHTSYLEARPVKL